MDKKAFERLQHSCCTAEESLNTPERDAVEGSVYQQHLQQKGRGACLMRETCF
jgi:hypothetical protein